MPNTIRPNQQRFIVELDAELAKRLESFRLSRGATRAVVVRKAIAEHVAEHPQPQVISGIVLPRREQRKLEAFCREGDGAVAEKVVSNALGIYVPYCRWNREAEARPESVSPLVEHLVHPDVAQQVARFCARTRVHARWFLEEAIQQHVAASERDQWQRFLFRAPSHVAAQLATLAEKTGTDPKNIIVRALDVYIAARLHDEPELKRRIDMLREESAAQLTLFQRRAEARS